MKSTWVNVFHHGGGDVTWPRGSVSEVFVNSLFGVQKVGGCVGVKGL